MVAADTPAKPGITVSPGRLTFTLSKDASQQTVPVTITNGYDAGLTLSAEFKGIDENAGLLIPSDSLDPSFASALRVSETSIVLAPHETQVVQVQVSNLPALSPGGHYATLVLTTQNSGGSQLSLKAAVSLSLFVTKVAGAQQKLSLTSVHTNGWLFHLPTSASLSFRNDGNVLSVPRGVVSVLDSQYNVLAKGIVNQQSLPLLPGKSFTSQVPVTGIAHPWKPQRLLIWTAYRADGINTQTIVRRTVWYIPPMYIALIIVLICTAWYVRRRGRRHLKSPMPIVRRFVGFAHLPTTSLWGTKFMRRPATNTSVTSTMPTVPIRSTEKIVTGAPELPQPIEKAAQQKKPATKPKAAPKKPQNLASATEKPSKRIAVSEPIPEQPLLTFVSLQQRTTRIGPRSTVTTKKAKRTADKPRLSSTAKTKPKSNT